MSSASLTVPYATPSHAPRLRPAVDWPTLDCIYAGYLVEEQIDDRVFRVSRNGKQFALKQFERGRDDSLLPEEDVAAIARHDHILEMVDIDRDRGFIVTPFCPLGTVASLIARRKHVLPLRDVCTILLQVVDALEKVHERGLIHLDLKPSNIVITSQRPWRMKLCDFGLARKESSADGRPAFIGTKGYAAPEQWGRGGRLTPKSDIFAAGVMGYELTTLHAVPRWPNPDVRSLELVSLPFRDLIDSMVALDPDLRPDAASVKRKLQCILRSLPD